MKCATKAEMLRCDMFAAWIVKGSVNTGQQGSQENSMLKHGTR